MKDNENIEVSELDISKLEENLDKMTGRDFISCAKAERMNGNYSSNLTTDPEFQARLIAYALKTDPGEIEDLPMSKFVALLSRVSIFLAKDLEIATLLKKL